MRVILCDNYKEMSEAAAKIVAGQIMLKPDCVLGLATGSTPVGMYNELAKMYQSGELDFSNVKSFNLDEYYPLSADNEQSYHYFMNENLFSKVNIKKENTHILNGLAEDPEEECRNFEKMIDQSGGVDLQILGIGENGHIGFNEPSAKLNTKTHLTGLTKSTINANSRFFDSVEDVPDRALTMGIATILKSKKIILMASGAAKHRAVKAMLKESIDTDVPATVLNLHHDVVLICDKAAYYSQRIGIDIGGTDIKLCVLDDNNKLVHKESVPTEKESAQKLVGALSERCREISENFSITAVGVGTPGIIKNSAVSAVNLPFKDFELAKSLSKEIGLPVRVSNDANCAALGEAICGVGEKAKNIIMISLGTGIGGGIVIDNKIYEGNGSAGEIGHFCIKENGRECPCGKKGCFEQYASATALIKEACSRAQQSPDSVLGKIYKENGGKLSGVDIKNALEKGCAAAKAAMDIYTGSLAMGIDSLASIFDPDLFVLSGGITNMGDLLIQPLKDKLKTDIPVEISVLKNDAGAIGAALLQ